MKKWILLLVLSGSLWALEGAVAKNVLKVFSKESVAFVSKKYGQNGMSALEKLAPKYGQDALGLVEKYGARYGDDGLRLLGQYGERAVANPTAFELVKKFGAEGYYLLRQFPKKILKYYKQFGDKFVKVSAKTGNTRMMRYMDGASKYGKEDKVLRFLEKYGEKGNVFLDRHWGKLLTSGFVLLNAESLVDSVKNVANHTVDKGASVVENSVKNVADSQLGLFLGLALLLFIFFKYGIDTLVNVWKKFRNKTNY